MSDICKVRQASPIRVLLRLRIRIVDPLLICAHILSSNCSLSSSPPTANAAMATIAVMRTYLVQQLARVQLVVKARVRTATRVKDLYRARNNLARLLSLKLQRLLPQAPMVQRRPRLRTPLRQFLSPLHGEQLPGYQHQSLLQRQAGTHVSLSTQAHCRSRISCRPCRACMLSLLFTLQAFLCLNPKHVVDWSRRKSKLFNPSLDVCILRAFCITVSMHSCELVWKRRSANAGSFRAAAPRGHAAAVAPAVQNGPAVRRHQRRLRALGFGGHCR